MMIDVMKEDNTCVLHPQGWIDSANSAELEGAVMSNAAECEKIILDLADVDYISSAGLRVIVAAHREMEKKQGLIIRNMKGSVHDIISLTGFDKKLNIEK